MSITVAQTIIRSYERDLNNGIAAGIVRRHAKARVFALREKNSTGIADKLEVWINKTL